MRLLAGHFLLSFKNTDELIEILGDTGLDVSDEQLTRYYLGKIGPHRLGKYYHAFFDGSPKRFL